jgi:hypothetical protein
VGPEALVLGAQLNKQMGLSLGHTGRVLESGYGLEFSRGGIYKALARLASKAEPTYQGLLLTGRKSLVNWVDETGWRVGGRSQWLWVAESELVTVYSILPGRGSEQLKQILGADYNGWLVHDGLRCYSKLDKACHQTCLTHLIRRCKEMADRATQSAAQFPLQVKTLLQQALLLDDRYERQEMTSHGLAVATGLIEAAMDRLLDKDYRSASNKRMAKHLRQQREYLFTFLHCPGLGGTNNRAERAIRPAVIARKVWGGNRTWIFEGDLRMRTNVTGDRQTITLWPAELTSRGDGSCLPFRRIWQSTRSNFSSCSQPQHFRTVRGIFSREGAYWDQLSTSVAMSTAADLSQTGLIHMPLSPTGMPRVNSSRRIFRRLPDPFA